MAVANSRMADLLKRQPLSLSAISWSLFESGRTTYVVLISVYVFIPYVATVLVGDPVRGQQVIAQLGQWAGIAVALVAPFIGSTIDRLGRRKPFILALTLLAVPLTAALWFARPDHAGLSISQVAWILAIIGLIFSLCEVMHNSMVVYSAKPHEVARASGLAHACGNAAAVILMVVTLWAFVLPGTISGSWLPGHPLLGLQAAAHEPERFAGPIVAIILLLSVAPLLLFAKDAQPTGLRLGAAAKAGARDLIGLFALFKEAPDAGRFLLARVIFAEGQGGIVMFTGVFAAGVLGWGPTELLIEGVVASVFAALGGLLAGEMDMRLGAKRSLLISLGAMTAFIIGEIGMAKEHIFYFFAYDPAINGRPWAGPLFNTWPDLAFVACDLGVSVFVVAGFASGRTMMAHLAPPGKTAAMFGLFALSGRATAWICPALVAITTAAFHSQQMGLIPIVGMTVLGMIALTWVRDPGAVGHVIPEPQEIAVAANPLGGGPSYL